jgi:uncharacterized ferritin-like protein (DUF455 family)
LKHSSRAATVEDWAEAYVTSADLEVKFDARAIPERWADTAPPVRIDKPGRPSSLEVSARAQKSPGPEALRAPAKRAQLVHTFLHHELQAAELFAWGLLAFADAPDAFRRGLLAIARDEIRHMGLYRDHLASLGFSFGDFPVRDWFWERVPSAPTAAHFVAALGIGFEGANLDHAERFASRFRAVGDAAGAALQERIGRDEVSHVRFATSWFERFTGRPVEFASWGEHLSAPLSPLVMRGEPMNTAARRRAGLSADFLDELRRWSPV